MNPKTDSLEVADVHGWFSILLFETAHHQPNPEIKTIIVSCEGLYQYHWAIDHIPSTWWLGNSTVIQWPWCSEAVSWVNPEWLAVNWGVVEVVLAILDSLQISFTEGWWCRARALALKVKSKAKLNNFSSTATELGVVVTRTNYYYYNTSSSSNLSKLKVKTAM